MINTILMPFVVISIIAGLILLLRNMLFKKSKLYPSLAYFSAHKRNRGYAARIWRYIIKILLFILLCLFITLFLMKPAPNSGKHILIVEMTPHVQKYYDSIISCIDAMKDTMNIVQIMHTEKCIADKADIVSFVMHNMHLLSSNNVMLLTDRYYNDAPFTVINVYLPNDEITVTDVGNIITFWSSNENTVKLNIYAEGKLQYGTDMHAKTGYNYVHLPVDIQYDSISFNSTGLHLYETVFTEKYFINDRTNLPLIRYALDALGYTIDGRSTLSLSLNDNIDRGIVLSQYGQTYVKEGEREFSGYNILEGIGMEGLHYECLDHYSGNVIMKSDAGEELIIRKKDVFYINIPADTGMSNFLMIPEGIIALDVMIRALNEDYSGLNAQLMKYNRETLESDDSVYIGPGQDSGSNHIFGIFAIVLMLALLIL